MGLEGTHPGAAVGTVSSAQHMLLPHSRGHRSPAPAPVSRQGLWLSLGNGLLSALPFWGLQGLHPLAMGGLGLWNKDCSGVSEAQRVAAEPLDCPFPHGSARPLH